MFRSVFLSSPVAVQFAPLLLLLTLVACGPSKKSLTPVEASLMLEQASEAFEKNDSETASKLLADLLDAPLSDPQEFMKAAQIAKGLKEFSNALRFYEKLSEAEGSKAVGLSMMADTYMYDLGQSKEAEATFRKVITEFPSDGMALEGLGHLLQIQGRVHESIPYLIRAVRSGRITIRNLVVLGWTQVPPDNRQTFKLCLKHDPKDANALLGYARIESYLNKKDSALDKVRLSVGLNPKNLVAQALLGELLLEERKSTEFNNWYAALPSDAESHPDVLLVLGKWAEQTGDLKSAGFAYLECLKANPDEQDAAFRLGNVLVKLGEKKDAKKYLDRAAQLEAYGLLLGKMHDNDVRSNPHWITEAMSRCEKLGRFDEAVGWCRVALVVTPQSTELKALLNSLSRLLPRKPDSRTSRQIFDSEELFADVSLPEPKGAWATEESQVTQNGNPDGPKAKIKFVDVSKSVGIDFRYFNAANDAREGFRMFESMGGGGGALDFDLDGFPDLYFTNGSEWPSKNGNANQDMLYRNLDGEAFVELSEPAGIEANQFGQGMTYGDVNGDGFPDIYIANIGKNQLWINNGDGTFSDATDEFDLDDEQWTASVAIADLTGDGLPEIYDVNYLGGDDVFTRDCKYFGSENNCRPALFEPAQDQLYFNTGVAPYQNVTESSGIVLPDGNGLGIVIAEMDDQPGNDVFVANDFVPNFFFTNSGNSKDGAPQLLDQARFFGLAFDKEGRYQACMGVAFDDADANGLPDLFVTNFSDESNTFYKQVEPGIYEDETNPAKLRDGSFDYVGFGTQFIDADLDSRPDLIITNGDLSPTTEHDTGKKEMPAQFYWSQSGKFTELAPESLGPFFSEKVLGRGLFYVDWDRDGKDDIGISFLDRDVALLKNQTETDSQSISIRLVGTSSERIPHGAKVTVHFGEKKITRQLSAGDGYMVSNSKELIFGLGSADKCDQINVAWPSGESQTFPGFSTGEKVLLIEGRRQPLKLTN